MRLTGALLSLVALCVVAAGASRQNPPPPSRPLQARPDLVQVEVSVLDLNRRPVRGLTAADFGVFENGEPQRIVAVSAVDVPGPAGRLGSWIRDISPDVCRNDADRRLVFLVVDDATLPFGAREISTAKAISQSVIDRLGPADLGALIFTSDHWITQDLTPDRALLRAAAEKINPGFGTPESQSVASLSALTKAVDRLAAARPTRKVLVFVSAGLVTNFDMGQGTSRGARETQYTFVQRLQKTVRTAQAANVSIYGIDPTGLNVSLDHGVEFLDSLSKSTGGFAITRTNTPLSEIDRLFQENSSYYLIGYERSAAAADAKSRSLDLAISRTDASVRVRTGDSSSGGEASPEKTATADASPLAKAIAGPLPVGALPMRVSVAPFAVPGRRDAAVAIVASVEPLKPAVRRDEQVELVATAFDPKDRAAASQRQTARIDLPEGDTRAGYEVLLRLDLRPGRYQLRLAATSAAQAATGSVFCDVEVPDFAKEALSLSGVVLGTTAGVRSAAKEALAAVVPVVPTTRREFATGDQVTAFLRVYQGGRAPVQPTALIVRIVNSEDALVFEASDTLGPDRFGSLRTADYRIELPLARLTTGDHLLIFETTGGTQVSARRAVRFVVR